MNKILCNQVYLRNINIVGVSSGDVKQSFVIFKYPLSFILKLRVECTLLDDSILKAYELVVLDKSNRTIDKFLNIISETRAKEKARK